MSNPFGYGGSYTPKYQQQDQAQFGAPSPLDPVSGGPDLSAKATAGPLGAGLPGGATTPMKPPGPYDFNQIFQGTGTGSGEKGYGSQPLGRLGGGYEKRDDLSFDAMLADPYKHKWRPSSNVERNPYKDQQADRTKTLEGMGLSQLRNGSRGYYSPYQQLLEGGGEHSLFGEQSTFDALGADAPNKFEAFRLDGSGNDQTKDSFMGKEFSEMVSNMNYDQLKSLMASGGGLQGIRDKFGFANEGVSHLYSRAQAPYRTMEGSRTGQQNYLQQAYNTLLGNLGEYSLI